MYTFAIGAQRRLMRVPRPGFATATRSRVAPRQPSAPDARAPSGRKSHARVDRPVHVGSPERQQAPDPDVAACMVVPRLLRWTGILAYLVARRVHPSLAKVWSFWGLVLTAYLPLTVRGLRRRLATHRTRAPPARPQ